MTACTTISWVVFVVDTQRHISYTFLCKRGLLKHEKDGHISMKLMRYPLILFVVGTFLCGCALARLEREITELSALAYLHGKVLTESQEDRPIVIVLYSKTSNREEIIDFKKLCSCGAYLFVVPEGEYYIFAFQDSDNNFRYDQHELAGHYGSPDKITAFSNQTIRNLDIIISDSTTTKPTFMADFKISKLKVAKCAPGRGTVVHLDDRRFSSAYGSKGLWQPATFIKEIGGGIYFLEEYDRHKVPILFIHGSGGTPRDWSYFINNVDRRRYQPWLFFYPSAVRLERSGTWLNQMIEELHARHEFEKLYVTAHSMGGLIARSSIIGNPVKPERQPIRLFVSIATPWDGHQGAGFGARHAPLVIPSWKDLAPRSDFLRSIFQQSLPRAVKYYLFFGYKGIGIPFTRHSDGSVTIKSALHSQAQREAIKIYGFDEDHAGMLMSKKVLQQFNEILTELDSPHG